MSYAIGAVSLFALCTVWVLVQRYVASQEPEVRGPETSTTSCCGACGTCERAEPVEEIPVLPRAHARDAAR